MANGHRSNQCATYIAPQAQTWLTEPVNGRILHLFPNACNLVNEAGHVLSLVTNDLDPNPLAIVLPSLHFPDFITTHDVPWATQDAFSIGHLTINLQSAVSWHPVPPWHNPLDLDLIQTIVTNHPDFETAVPLHLAGQMQQALQHHDATLVAQTACQLAGLGTGLTPAGDDFLMGMMYSLWHQSSDFSKKSDVSLITDYCSLITASAVPHTTTLSANLLQAAGRGEASQTWHDLLSVQTSKKFKTSEVYNAYHTTITRILHTGHSSGSDALFGFLIGATI